MNHDDPKLTAYALGELEGAELAEVETLLARDEAARRVVEEIRRTAGVLRASLAQTKGEGLTAGQREAIAAEARGEGAAVIKRTDRRTWAGARKWAGAVAACVAIGGVTVSIVLPRLRHARQQSAKTALIAASKDSKEVESTIYDTGGLKLKEVPEFQDSLDFSLQSSGGASASDRGRGSGVGAGGAVFGGAGGGQGRASTPGRQPAGNGQQQGQQNAAGGYGIVTGQTAQGLGMSGPVTGGVVITSDGDKPDPRSGLLSFGTNAKPPAAFKVPDPYYVETLGEGARVDRFSDSGGLSKEQLSRQLGSGVAMYGRGLTPQDGGVQWSGGSVLLPGNQVIPGRDMVAATQPAFTADPVTAESYAKIYDNPFMGVEASPLSTFSIDVDTGSYSNVRRFLSQGAWPPADAVRIEEMLNYFPYSYEKPKEDSKDPFAATVEVAACPWDTSHRLARVAVKGKEIAHDKRPVSNLVFLIDVSGSMNEPRKLPLVKEGLKLLVNELTENDRVSMVVYAGAAGLVLPSTHADPKNKEAILNAIERLSAGGSTNGGQGVELAYRIAAENFIKGGTNRVILATDGDWNVGITDQGSLVNLIETQAKSGVFLSVLGYGYGNLKDSTLEKLADKGNGHYAYIDDIKESRKVLVEEMSGTLVTIAKDVKVQVEFNPAKVQSYRLIGYENRMLAKEDFNNDKVDAGEIGAGHAVTALYEIVPAKVGVAQIATTQASAKPATQPATRPVVDDLTYEKAPGSGELLRLKLRYKKPDGDVSTKVEVPVVDKGLSYAKASEDFKFSAAVAQFGMILRGSPHKGTASLDGVLELGEEGKGKDEKGYRAEFLEMVKKAKGIKR